MPLEPPTVNHLYDDLIDLSKHWLITRQAIEDKADAYRQQLLNEFASVLTRIQYQRNVAKTAADAEARRRILAFAEEVWQEAHGLLVVVDDGEWSRRSPRYRFTRVVIFDHKVRDVLTNTRMVVVDCGDATFISTDHRVDWLSYWRPDEGIFEPFRDPSKWSAGLVESHLGYMKPEELQDLFTLVDKNILPRYSYYLFGDIAHYEEGRNFQIPVSSTSEIPIEVHMLYLPTGRWAVVSFNTSNPNALQIALHGSLEEPNDSRISLNPNSPLIVDVEGSVPLTFEEKDYVEYWAFTR